MPYEYVSVSDIKMEKDLYRALTQLKYRNGEASISSIFNDMLKEYLHTYLLSKSIGHILIPRDIIKVAVNAMNDEEIKQASIDNVVRYRDGALLEHGRASLAAYLDLIRAHAKANKFDMKISKNPDNGNQVLIVSFQMGGKFTQFLGNTYRMLLEEFADIERIEMTATTSYFEYKPKKEVVQEAKNL